MSLDGRLTIHCGDALETLRTMANGSVDCIVTSPPYFGLRAYLPDGHPDKHLEHGLEQSPDEYVARLVEVFREARRVLADTGTCWINIGDSYAGSWGNQGRKAERGTQRPINGGMITSVHDGRYPEIATKTGSVERTPGCKPKDLIGIPWLLAFALRADGWYLRQDIIWSKPNPMPESVTDRCTKAHEHVFLLSKQARYWYDAKAVAEPANYPGDHGFLRGPIDGCDSPHVTWRAKSQQTRKIAGVDSRTAGTDTRNRRSVWTIATQPYEGAHYAVMPAALAELCIKAGCEKGKTVLDPFGGAGTTAIAALRHGRKAVLIELNPENCEMARRRIEREWRVPQRQEHLPIIGGLFGDVA